MITTTTTTPTSPATVRSPRWLRRIVTSAAVVAGLLLTGTGIASAEGVGAASGYAGPAHVRAIGGGYERVPSSNLDTAAASVTCLNNSLGHRAVLAGGFAWSYNARSGSHNDWQYVRFAAMAMDNATGVASYAPLSAAVVSWDDTGTTFGQSTVWLQRGHTYTIRAAFWFFNGAGQFVGTRVVTPQTAVYRVSMSYPYGEYTNVSHGSTVEC